MVRVLPVEDHEVVRAELRGVLVGCPDIQIVIVAGDGEEAVIQARHHQPVIMKSICQESMALKPPDE